jgi:hypothetical protein
MLSNILKHVYVRLNVHNLEYILKLKTWLQCNEIDLKVLGSQTAYECERPSFHKDYSPLVFSLTT